MINEDIYDISKGIRNESERIAYLYSEIEKQHKRRYLFEPLRVLDQADFISEYIEGRNPFPKSIEIDPTNFCNHDCPFCIYSSMHKPGRKERIPDDNLFRLILEAWELGVKSILFIGGGEPLGHSKTVEAIKYANELGIAVGLVTNGSLVKEKDVDTLVSEATYIRFSIDAATATTHATMHQSADFERVISNLALLSFKNRKATIGVSYFVSEINFHEISLAASLVKENGADYIQFKTYAGIAFPNEYYPLLLKEIEKAISLSDNGFDVYIMDNIFDQDIYQSRNYSQCHWQGFKTIINADGNVYLCTQKRGKQDAVIGNIYESSLYDIWNGEKRKQVIKSIALKECPYCVHHTQNKIIEFLTVGRNNHASFY